MDTQTHHCMVCQDEGCEFCPKVEFDTPLGKSLDEGQDLDYTLPSPTATQETRQMPRTQISTIPLPKHHGNAVLTCRNHPTYRWVKTKYSLTGVNREYIGAGVLMFQGEEGGKPAHPLMVLSEHSLSQKDPEYQQHYREQYTPECNCPSHDLVFVKWAED